MRERLTPAQWELFSRLQSSEQVHAIAVFRKLLEQGENQPDLLVAALLHDIGKLQYRLNLFERAMIVVAKALVPRKSRRWGKMPTRGWEDLPGWRKAFILAEQHAVWGAEMARKVGVSPLSEALIRHHHHLPKEDTDQLESNLLRKLWIVDNDS